MNKYLKKAYLQNTDEKFAAIVENMKRKAAKGLLNESAEQIDKDVSEIYAQEAEYAALEEEVDAALEKFSYMIEE